MTIAIINKMNPQATPFLINEERKIPVAKDIAGMARVFEFNVRSRSSTIIQLVCEAFQVRFSLLHP